MAAAREAYYALACQHLSYALHYLASLAPGGAPLHPAFPPAAGPLPQVLPPPAPARPHRRHDDHRVEIREEEDDEDDDEEVDDEEDDDEEENREAPDEVRDVIAPGGADDGDAGWDFAAHDLLHAVWPLLAAVPPYPLYSRLSESAIETAAWVWYLFLNALLFSVAVTYFSVVMFRSSRRFLPTLLRALLLAVTVGAEAAAAFHLPPNSTLATGLSYASISLHLAIYLFTWAAYCRWSRRRLHPLP